MGLFSDQKEYQDAWSRSSLAGKMLAGVFFFLALSSLTSLSSAVYEWKGFLLSGLEFYQEHIADNIRWIASLVGLSYAKSELDAMLLTSIAVTTGMRALARGQIDAFKVINDRNGSDLSPPIWPYRTIVVLGIPALWLWYGLFEPTIWWWNVLGAFLLYPLIITGTKWLVAKVAPNHFGNFESPEFSYYREYYLPVGGLILALCVLAAVNEGLSRGA